MLFTENPALSRFSLTPAQAEILTIKAGVRGLLGTDILSIISVVADPDNSVYADGRDENGDYKSFVDITLERKAKAFGEAEIPPKSLDRILALTPAILGLPNAMDGEGNWEFTDCEQIDAIRRHAA